MKTVCILQARFGSTRLPGKVTASLAGRPVLAHVIERCRAVEGVDAVVVATVDEPASATILRLCEAMDVAFCFGPEADVLERFRLAAETFAADIVMRITSDCPLCDPFLAAAVLAPVARGEADYAANNMPPSFPHGLDCEVFTRTTLERAAAEAGTAFEREHVTTWMRNSPSLRRKAVEGPGGGIEKWRWTVDFPEDLDFLDAVMVHLPSPPPLDWRAVAVLLEAEPHLLEINRARWQR